MKGGGLLGPSDIEGDGSYEKVKKRFSLYGFGQTQTAKRLKNEGPLRAGNYHLYGNKCTAIISGFAWKACHLPLTVTRKTQAIALRNTKKRG